MYLPWRDVLHDGPVPAGLDLAGLSEFRAAYIAGCGWAETAAVAADFQHRDQRLREHGEFDRVLLWFEHDLYDQLQILQILDWFAEHGCRSSRLSMICTEQYLGMAAPAALRELREFERDVDAAQLELAVTAWAAFRAADPLAWHALLGRDTRPLPFLRGAVLRQLEEYPGIHDGLSRTARQALHTLAAGEVRPGRLFARNQDLEARVFMGDWSFWRVLEDLLACQPSPLRLRGAERLWPRPPPTSRLSLSETGRALLSGEVHLLDLAPPRRWIGGVEIAAPAAWCWDERAQRPARRGSRSR